MKRIIISVICILIVICSIVIIMNNRIKNTDLLNVKIDGLNIGAKENKIDLTNYTKSDRFSGNYKYKFEEIVIGINNKKEINYLYGKTDQERITITVNGKNIKLIDDIESILGKNYHKKNYDREQQLKEYIYKDYSNYIKLEVVYSTNNNEICWLILSKF